MKQQKIEPTAPVQVKKEKKEPTIKKPPRKSKLPEPVVKNRQTVSENASTPQNGRRFKKNGEDPESSGPPSLPLVFSLAHSGKSASGKNLVFVPVDPIIRTFSLRSMVH